MEITYRESGHLKYIQYRLFDDRIQIKNGQFLGTSSVVEFPLNELRPNQSKVQRRDFELNPIQYALGFFGAAGVVFACLSYAVDIWVLFASLIAYAGLVTGLILLRSRIEYTVFLFLDHSPLFAIGKRGKRKAEYEPFVQELVLRIKRANQASEVTASSRTSS